VEALRKTLTTPCILAYLPLPRPCEGFNLKNMKQLISALLKAQSEMGNAKKDAANPFFKSKYADLNSVREAVMPLLNQNGIIVLQPMVTKEGCEYVKTVLLHESGEAIESFTKILCKAQNDPQAYGSGVTYARRYGLQSLLSIGADDDDGNAASKVDPYKELRKLEACKTVEELGAAFKALPNEIQKTLSKHVTEFKTKLENENK
jgi:hypothetical protein